MTRSAVRLTEELLRELERADDGRMPVADVWRRIGEAAERAGLPRPSYERIRTIVGELRLEAAEPTTAEIAFDVMMRLRPPEALVDHLDGVRLPRVR